MKMMTALALFAMLVLSSCSSSSPEQAPAATAEQPQQTVQTDDNDRYWQPPLGMIRGLTNACTCPLELVRCIYYDAQAVPVLGLFGGIIEGAGFTVYRALDGVLDVVSFGASGNYMHGPVYENFVWQSRWNPPKDERLNK